MPVYIYRRLQTKFNPTQPNPTQYTNASTIGPYGANLEAQRRIMQPGIMPRIMQGKGPAQRRIVGKDRRQGRLNPTAHRWDRARVNPTAHRW